MLPQLISVLNHRIQLSTLTIYKFVKDKENLLDYNQWSCAVYNKTLSGFNGANIGSYSIEDHLSITQRTPASWGYFDVYFPTLELNTNYYFETLLKSNAMWIMAYTEAHTITSVTINPSNDYQPISLSFNPSISNGYVRWFNNIDGCILELKSLKLCKR